MLSEKKWLRFQVAGLAALVGASVAAAAQNWLPTRFLHDQMAFQAWLDDPTSPATIGHPGRTVSLIYDTAFGWTGLDLAHQAVLVFAAISAVASIRFLQASRTARVAMAFGLPFLAAFATPAGKEQLLILALSPIIVTRASNPSSVAVCFLPAIAYSLLIRPYWLLLLVPIILGVRWRTRLPRGQWARLCLAGGLLVVGIVYSAAPEAADWRSFANERPGAPASDYDTAFDVPPETVTGFPRGVLNSAYAAWQLLTLRPVTDIANVHQWGGYVALGVLGIAWWRSQVTRDDLAADLFVGALPVLVSLQLWFEPDFGSMVRHLTPFFLLIGRSWRPAATRVRSTPRFDGLDGMVGALGGAVILVYPWSAYTLMAACLTAVAASICSSDLRCAWQGLRHRSRKLAAHPG